MEFGERSKNANTLIQFPIGRFTPSFSKDIILSWVKGKVPPGGLIFDPFCSNPWLDIMLANEGFQIFTCCNNPIIKIALESQALAILPKQLNEVLGLLGEEKRAEETVKEYILSLYKSTCSICQSEIIVNRYIWSREPLMPIKKIYFCEHCEVNREVVTDEKDLQKIDEISKQQLPLTWALNRLGSTFGYGNTTLRDVINLYTSRAILVLFTLINRVEAMRVDGRTQKILRAIVINACDGGSGYWNEDGSSPNMKQLIKPAFFIEHNIWHYLETSIKEFAGSSNQVFVSDYPEIAQRNGICIFNGKARAAFPLLEGLRVKSIVMQLPRINPVFFTLCGLWSGWIYGKEKLSMLQGVFQTRDYDWQWQGKALASTFGVLSRFLPGIPCFGHDSDGTNGSILAAALAAQSAGWGMEWMVQDKQKKDCYFEFFKQSIEPTVNWSESKDELSDGLISSIKSVGKNFNYDELFGRFICIASKRTRFVSQTGNVPLNLLSACQALLNEILNDSSKFSSEDLDKPLHERTWSISTKEEPN